MMTLDERRLLQDIARELFWRLDRVAAGLEAIADAERRGAEAAQSVSAKEWLAVADAIASIGKGKE